MSRMAPSVIQTPKILKSTPLFSKLDLLSVRCAHSEQLIWHFLYLFSNRDLQFWKLIKPNKIKFAWQVSTRAGSPLCQRQEHRQPSKRCVKRLVFYLSKRKYFWKDILDFFFLFEQNTIFFSRKLYINLSAPSFRWPWRRLRKKPFFLLETGSEELKHWNFIYTYVTFSLQHFSRPYFFALQEAGLLNVHQILGDWCAKMAPIFIGFKMFW